MSYPNLIQRHGHPSTDIIPGGRPFAEPGIFGNPVAQPAPSPCDWFDPAADTPWNAKAAAADWHTDATGGWRDAAADADWHTDATGGWRRRKPCG